MRIKKSKQQKGLYLEEDVIEEVEKIAAKNERSWMYTVAKLVKIGLNVVQQNEGRLD